MGKISKPIFWITSGIISLIPSLVGGEMIKQAKENLFTGILLIILSLVLLYFSYYATEIKENKDKIESIEEKISKFEEDKKIKEKLLNTIRDIVILEK